MGNEIMQTLERALECVRMRTDFVPRIALVLGSGLGDFAESIDAECIINYADIDGFPHSTVDGHKGRYVFGYVSGVPVVAMQGRVHYYEGYKMTDVVMPVRLMGLLGAKTLFLTNAAGGTDPTFKAGDFMLITGQISSFVPSPLLGANVSELGVRFPDMSGLYDVPLRNEILAAAEEIGLDLKQGVYIQLPGPNFESVAEVKMCGILGASAVGMSTACEAIAARHMGMYICGVSCITNMGAGLSKTPQTHTEVNETAAEKSDIFAKLMTISVQRIDKLLQS